MRAGNGGFSFPQQSAIPPKKKIAPLGPTSEATAIGTGASCMPDNPDKINPDDVGFQPLGDVVAEVIRKIAERRS
jgi:hypothetical protein